MKRDVTYLGRVINVNSDAVEVEVSQEIPSSAPIIKGRIHRIGQIGTLVKIVVGNLKLFGLVSSVSNTHQNSSLDQPIYLTQNYGSRFLQIQLIGEQIGNNDFEKGIGSYPTINDEVYLVVEEDLAAIYGNRQKGVIDIGTHSSSEKLPVFLDVHNLILRHSAIIGSTGSGKSNAAAHILKSILKELPGSRIILVDTHGEYSSAFSEEEANVLKINDASKPLIIPFWIMNFDELSFFLVSRQSGQEKPEDKKLRESILEMKLANADKLKAGKITKEFITADSPIPFDLKLLWYQFNRTVNATYNIADEKFQTEETEMLVKEGDYKKLLPTEFEPYESVNRAPFKAKDQTMYVYERKILSILRDSRFNFMFNPDDYVDSESNDIDKLLRDWIGSEKRLTILDLSGVPFELIDISVGIITRFLFDSMYWGRFEEYTGRSRPLLMVFDESHTYLPKAESSTAIYGYARKSVERVFKEGRKFGIGAMVLTQRPSEISETILAQVGTFIALRLTNSSDKGTVKAASPNNMTSLMDLLPALRIGEAIVVGEAIKIPSRIRIPLVEPRPNSDDPKVVQAWSNTFNTSDTNYKNVITSLREKRISK